MGQRSPKDVEKAYGNVKMEWAEDAQKNETGRESPKEGYGPREPKMASKLTQQKY